MTPPTLLSLPGEILTSIIEQVLISSTTKPPGLGGRDETPTWHKLHDALTRSYPTNHGANCDSLLLTNHALHHCTKFAASGLLVSNAFKLDLYIKDMLEPEPEGPVSYQTVTATWTCLPHCLPLTKKNLHLTFRYASQPETVTAVPGPFRTQSEIMRTEMWTTFELQKVLCDTWPRSKMEFENILVSSQLLDTSLSRMPAPGQAFLSIREYIWHRQPIFETSSGVPFRDPSNKQSKVTKRMSRWLRIPNPDDTRWKIRYLEDMTEVETRIHISTRILARSSTCEKEG